MPDFITLSCPACGGKLQITDDVERFACAHCGSEHLVRRDGGIVYLQQSLNAFGSSLERNTAELAIPRLNEEIAQLQQDIVDIDDKLDSCRSEIRALEQQAGKSVFDDLLSSLKAILLLPILPGGCLALLGCFFLIWLLVWFFIGVKYLPHVLIGIAIIMLVLTIAESQSGRKAVNNRLARRQAELCRLKGEQLPRRAECEALLRKKQQLLEHYQNVAG